MKIYVFTHVSSAWDTYVVLAENEAGAYSKVRAKIADQIAARQIFPGPGGAEYVVDRLSVEEFDPADVVVIESNE